MIKIVWIVRGVKDYRVPVYNELAGNENVSLSLIFNKDLSIGDLNKKISNKIFLKPVNSEIIYGPKDNNAGFANKSFRATYIPGLYSLIKKSSPNVIIVEGFFQYSFYGYIYKFLNNNIKLICSYERTSFTERKAQISRKIFRKMMLKLTDSVVCNGSLSKQYVRSLGFNKEIFIGNMTVDIDLINRKVKYYNSNKLVYNTKLVFIYVGLLTERKGLRELFDVWREFEKKFKNSIELNIVGKGALESELINFKKEHSLKTINFIGQVSYELMIKYLSESNILINPTLEDNWSLVVPEAMAAELPIITTKFNGLYPELISDKNGWIIDIINKKESMKTLTEVINNQQKLSKMGVESYKMIKKYHPSKIADNFLNASKKIK